MLTRRRIYLEPVAEGPAAAAHLESEGFVVLEQALSPDEVAALHRDVTRVYDEHPPDVRNPNLSDEERGEFRYELLNRSEEVQRLVADRRILDVIEPLLGEDCHVIANTGWRNPPQGRREQGGGNWHMDSGPHVPRPEGVPWDERIPYPVFAIGTHVLLEDCPLESGPTEVIPRSHRSGRPVPFDRIRDDDLTHDGVGGTVLTGRAGDIALFVSDVWHRRHPTGEGDRGRFFVQIHYGRRDIAQRIRPTSDVHHLSPDAVERAATRRDRTVAGLHAVSFYDG